MISLVSFQHLSFSGALKIGVPINKPSPPREVIENWFNFVNKLGYESRQVVCLEILRLSKFLLILVHDTPT